MFQNIVSVVEIVILLAVIGWLCHKAIKVLKPLFTHPEFFGLVMDSVAEAEDKFKGDGRGRDKLEYVVSILLGYCEDNGINFTESALERIVNLTVSAVNLIKAFVARSR